MPLDREVFRRAWTLLEQRWGAKGSELAATYYQHVQHMEDDAFRAAVTRVLTHEDYFPRIAKLSNTTSIELEAAEQWEKVTRLLRNFSSPLDSLDEPAQRAVRQMGGLSVIGADVEQLHWRRREFMELYESAAAPERDALPPMSEDGKKLIQQAMAGKLEAP